MLLMHNCIIRCKDTTKFANMQIITLFFCEKVFFLEKRPGSTPKNINIQNCFLKSRDIYYVYIRCSRIAYYSGKPPTLLSSALEREVQHVPLQEVIVG